MQRNRRDVVKQTVKFNVSTLSQGGDIMIFQPVESTVSYLLPGDE